MLRARDWAAAAAAALAVTLTGCGRDRTAEAVAAMNTSNIQRLGNMYAAFQNYKGGRGPKTETEFREFIRDFDPSKLKMMSIDPGNLDGLFTSERDGKPFKVRYNVGGGRGSVDAVVFEQDGANGTRQVGFTNTTVEDADSNRYQELLTGKGAGGGPPASGPPTGKGGRPTGAPPGAPTGPQQ
jgi:hypothetical protein